MSEPQGNFVYRESTLHKIDDVLNQLREILLTQAVKQAKDEHLYRDKKPETERFVVLSEHVMSTYSLGEFLHIRNNQ